MNDKTNPLIGENASDTLSAVSSVLALIQQAHASTAGGAPGTDAGTYWAVACARAALDSRQESLQAEQKRSTDDLLETVKNLPVSEGVRFLRELGAIRNSEKATAQ